MGVPNRCSVNEVVGEHIKNSDFLNDIEAKIEEY